MWNKEIAHDQDSPCDEVKHFGGGSEEGGFIKRSTQLELKPIIVCAKQSNILNILKIHLRP